MEDAPVTAATGALGPVVAKLSVLLRRRRGDPEYRLRRRTQKDVKLIRSKLKSIHSILWVTWEKEDRDTASKELRMEAWRLADDMNDAIDDFILTMKRSNDGRRFMEDKTQPSPFLDLKRRAVDVSERCQSKWQMETAHTTFSSLFSRKKTTIDSGPGKRRPRVFDTYVHKDISELVEMEEPRDQLMKHLMIGEEESAPQLKMASILGAAGVGKTTLARHVYEAIDKDKFKARAFVSILSCHNMTEVLASILRQVAAEDGTDVLRGGTKAATEEHLIAIISNFLKDKRYLIIVDDIWHYGEWKTIKMALPDNNLGSRIVTTSRVTTIAEKWHYDLDAFVWRIDYPLEHYGVKKMISLRPDMVGEGFDHGHPIVDMCIGVPLAVLCMTLAVAKERERQEQQGLCVVRTRDVQDRVQELVNRNGIQNTPGFEALVESLELGYNDLPHHMLKTCLLYCSIYPEGHCFVRYKSNDLVRRWIAEGFVCEEEAAQDYYDELVSRGFWKWIPDTFKGVIFQGPRSSSYEGQMHPMMRNYLRRKLQEENFITCTSDGVPSSPICRLCIDYWPSIDAVDPLSGIDWRHIRSLVVFKHAERVPYKHLEHLRVLDGAFNNQHLKDICGLLRLRHLFVPGAFGGEQITEKPELWPLDPDIIGPPGGEQITEMPADIVRLQYLETLDLRSTGITRLPSEIGGLKQLKVLDVSYCYGLTELPREMENLQHLETARFSNTNITEQAWEIIGTLKKLRTLDVCENFRFSRILRDIGELQQLKNLYMNWTSITELPKEIGKLQQLKNLDVSWNSGITFLPKEIGQLQNLEKLNVSGTWITELPKEIGNLGRLEALDLSGVRTITKLPREIGKLQHLERLHLLETNVRKIPREIGGLKKLKILDAQMGTLPFEAGQLPKLKGLPECVQRAWKNSDLVSSLSGEILSFQRVGNLGDGGLVMGTKHMHIPQWIKEHFNKIGSLDIRICKLEERDLEILREMPYLWKLTLRFEGVPRKPIAISSEGFAELVFLTVDSRVPRITFQEGAMPSLFVLEFKFQFYGGPPNTDPPMGIKHLVNLSQVRFLCNEAYPGDSPCISAAIDAVTKEAWEHPYEWFKVTLSVGGQRRVLFQKPKIVHRPEGTNEASSSGANETQEIQA